jgi:hypothetical protein
MTTSTTLARELDAQCRAIFQALEDAGFTFDWPAPMAALQTWIPLRPLLQMLRVPRTDQEDFTRRLRPNTGALRWVLTPSEDGVQVLYVPMLTLLQCLRWGRHPVCIAYQAWFSGVLWAVMRYGHYDPLTNHTPPPGAELAALERREEGRDLLNNLVPGMGDAVAGQRPTTDDGRRMIGYLRTDEDGHHSIVRDADIPIDEEDEDADENDLEPERP